MPIQGGLSRGLSALITPWPSSFTPKSSLTAAIAKPSVYVWVSWFIQFCSKSLQDESWKCLARQGPRSMKCSVWYSQVSSKTQVNTICCRLEAVLSFTCIQGDVVSGQLINWCPQTRMFSEIQHKSLWILQIWNPRLCSVMVIIALSHKALWVGNPCKLK